MTAVARVLLPAVDVADGQAVRLVQGEAGSETSYGDPLGGRAGLAGRAAPSGSTWSTSTRRSGAAPTATCSPRSSARSTCEVELSGGIRDDESLRAALATGCRAGQHRHRRAGGPASGARQAIAEHGDRVAVGLDVRGTTLAARGWTQEGGDLWEVLERLERDGCARYVVTDVTKDGTLRGPNLDLLREVCAATDRPVVASGGVSSLDDLRAHRRARARSASRARSSARRCTPARSRSRRRSPRSRRSRMSSGERLAAAARTRTSSATPAWSSRGDQAWTAGCTAIVDGEVVRAATPHAQT